MRLSVIPFIKVCTILILSSIVISGCQDPILVGGDLLEDEKINLEVIRDFSISSQTIPGTKVLTRTSGSKTYRLGEANDNVYGKTFADIYMKFGFNTASIPSFALDSNARFDSLVLVLRYDTLATYGKSSDIQSVKVYQLDEVYSSKDSFYSDTKLNYIPVPIYDKTMNISPKDSISIIEHATGKSVKQASQFRLKLDDVFGKSIFTNKDLVVDSIFRNFVKGIYITSRSVTGNPFLYGFDLSSASLGPTIPYNKLIMYYTISDTIKKSYDFQIDNAVINRYDLDYAGSTVSNFINQPLIGDSLAFTQGLGGVKTEIKFNDLDKIKNLLINKAELEINIADIPNVGDMFKNPPQIVLSTKNNKGVYEVIDDIAIPLSAGVSFVPPFGGVLVKNGAGYKYTMNITNHLKKVFRNPDFSSTLYVSVLFEAENPGRVAFYGAKHSQNPIRLNVYYTKN